MLVVYFSPLSFNADKDTQAIVEVGRYDTCHPLAPLGIQAILGYLPGNLQCHCTLASIAHAPPFRKISFCVILSERVENRMRRDVRTPPKFCNSAPLRPAGCSARTLMWSRVRAVKNGAYIFYV